MTITTNTTDRKQMVNEISEHLGIPAVYLRTPTYAFQIGKLTVNRDASISADDPADLETIKPLLIEKGYIEAEAPADEEPITDEITPEDSSKEELTESEAPEEIQEQPEPETEQVDDDSISMEISFPYGDNLSMIKNLVFMLYSKQTLLNHSTGNETLKVSDAVIEKLKNEMPETVDSFAALMNDFTKTGDLCGIGFENDQVHIAYGTLPDADWYNAFLHLTQKIMEAAANATRMFPEHQQPESEKYVMRSWLVRMGMGGSEFKSIRNHLLKNLTGHSAFPTEAAAQKHREKYALIRKEQRRAATTETEEVLQNEE